MKNEFIVSRKFKAGALQYAIFISFVISSILLSFIVYRGLRMRHIQIELDYFKKSNDLESALVVFLSNPAKYHNSKFLTIDVYNDSTSLVQMHKQAWGIWDIIKASIKYRDMTLEKSIIAGKDAFNGDSIALWVPDYSQTIYASGNTIIKGNAYLPVNKIQKASIEGSPFPDAEVVKGKITPSSKVLFDIATSLKEKITFWQDNDSLVQMSENVFNINDNQIEGSLTIPTKIYYSERTFQLSGIKAKNNIAFLSPSTIFIKKDAMLDHIIVSAHKVLIEDGFKGIIQVIAQDSVIVGKDCILEFPSAILVNNQDVSPTYVEIGSKSRLEGVIIVTQENQSTKEPFLNIEHQAIINGEVYIKGSLQLQGIIQGSLNCKGFFLKTKKAYYNNHLLDNEINFYSLHKEYGGIDFKNGYCDQILAFLEERMY